MARKAPLPAGAVTFAFTDIEGSTSRWERDRVAMQEAVRRVLRDVRAGEDFSAVHGLSVRAAIHSGSADARDGDYFGPALNKPGPAGRFC